MDKEGSFCNDVARESSSWQEATEKLREEDPQLFHQLEEMLAVQKQPLLRADLSNQIAQSIEASKNRLQDHFWRGRNGSDKPRLRKALDSILKALFLFGDMGNAVAHVDPLHAGILWTGVKLILQLVLNGIEQNAAAIEGLAQIFPIITRYAKMEEIYIEQRQKYPDTNLNKELKDILEAPTDEDCVSAIEPGLRAGSDTHQPRRTTCFRWVELQLKTFFSPKSTISCRDAFQRKLERLSQEVGIPVLGDVYDDIYDMNTPESEDRNVAERAPKWVMCCQRPLSIDMLGKAVSMDSRGQIDEVDAEYILHICSNFRIRIVCSMKIPPEPILTFFYTESMNRIVQIYCQHVYRLIMLQHQALSDVNESISNQHTSSHNRMDQFSILYELATTQT
ncbi:hypothetical protein BDW62DRAFT_199662 [Aspergillus aurantiobrunneus]